MKEYKNPRTEWSQQNLGVTTQPQFKRCSNAEQVIITKPESDFYSKQTFGGSWRKSWRVACGNIKKDLITQKHEHPNDRNILYIASDRTTCRNVNSNLVRTICKTVQIDTTAQRQMKMKTFVNTHLLTVIFDLKGIICSDSKVHKFPAIYLHSVIDKTHNIQHFARLTDFRIPYKSTSFSMQQSEFCIHNSFNFHCKCWRELVSKQNDHCLRFCCILNDHAITLWLSI